ncbi:MAG TPA: gas vesicle protein GvpD P-loop domain-containing protein [Thermoplasmata archaeon]|nr:gas vesicle protein GvpD P-loop domain-containing protein [Thermoplasmata archaeon]
MIPPTGLPPELREFLALPGPQTLVLRGPPGTGKTTLGLELLEEFPGEKVLITGRVPRERLLRDNPMLAPGGPPGIELVDTTESSGPVQTASLLERVPELLSSEGSEARLLTEFLWLPDAVQKAWARLRPGAHSIVVVDSWTALLEPYLQSELAHRPGAPTSIEVQRELLRRMRGVDAHLILIVEQPEPSEVEYLVDGVVTTSRQLFDNRLERWLAIPKLRGIRIGNATYPFTLDGARFHCLPQLPSEVPAERYGYEPDPEPVPYSVWPGSMGFASAFGRLRTGEVTLIEYDSEVPLYIPQVLSIPIIAATLRRGGRLLVAPPPLLPPEEVWAQIHEFLPTEEFEERIRILSAHVDESTEEKGDEGDDLALYTTLLPIPRISDSSRAAGGRSPEAIRFLRTQMSEGVPNLAVMYIEGMRTIARLQGMPFTPETFPAITTQYVYHAPAHLLYLARIGDPLAEAIHGYVSLHLRIRDREGRALIYGVRPRTGTYACEPNPPQVDSGAPYTLRPVV